MRERKREVGNWARARASEAQGRGNERRMEIGRAHV